MRSPSTLQREVWKAWLPALVWLGLIVVESTATLSSENTGRILYPLLHFLFGIDPIHFLTWHVVIRKTGHVVGYAVLSLLLFRAWRATISVPGNPRWSIAWARVALAMTALVASLDEWHQSFLPSRTGTVRDVFLDTAAGLVAQIVLFFWVGRHQRAEPPASPLRTPLNTPGQEHPTHSSVRE